MVSSLGSRQPASACCDTAKTAAGRLLLAWLRQLAGVFYPQECVVCGREDELLCAECFARLPNPGCDRLLSDYLCGGQNLTVSTARTDLLSLPVFYATEYTSAAAAVIVAYKEHGLTTLAPKLSRLLSLPLQRARQQLGLLPLLTVPSSRPAFQQRGFHPVERLLRQLDAVPPPVLRRTRDTADQSRLGRSERALNRRGSLMLRPGVTLQRRYLLVEDLVTSGATVREVQRVLEEAGSQLAAVVSLFRTAPASDVPAETLVRPRSFEDFSVFSKGQS